MPSKNIINTHATAKEDPPIYVYFNPKSTIRVCLKFPRHQINDFTLSNLISKSLKILSEDYLLEISHNKTFYCLFPASKTGCKKDGYP